MFFHTKVGYTPLAKFGDENPLSLRNVFMGLAHGHISKHKVKVALVIAHTPEVEVYCMNRNDLEGLVKDLSGTGLFRDKMTFSPINQIDSASHKGQWIKVRAVRPPRKTSFSTLAAVDSGEHEKWFSTRMAQIRKLPFFVTRSNSSGAMISPYISVELVDGFEGFDPNSYGFGTKTRTVTVPLV